MATCVNELSQRPQQKTTATLNRLLPRDCICGHKPKMVIVMIIKYLLPPRMLLYYVERTRRSPSTQFNRNSGHSSLESKCYKIECGHILILQVIQEFYSELIPFWFVMRGIPSQNVNMKKERIFRNNVRGVKRIR